MVGCFWKTWRNSVFIAVPSHGLHLKVYVHSLSIQTNFKISSLGNDSGVTPPVQSSVQANWGAFNQLLVLILEPALATPIAGYDLLSLRVTWPHVCPCLQLHLLRVHFIRVLHSQRPEESLISLSDWTQGGIRPPYAAEWCFRLSSLPSVLFMNSGMKTAGPKVSASHIGEDVSVKSEVFCCRSACSSPLTIKKV